MGRGTWDGGWRMGMGEDGGWGMGMRDGTGSDGDGG
jgi:hypothetical protein